MDMASLQFGVAPALAAALLHALWQDALLGIAAAFALRAMARASAAWRHTVAMGFLVAMLLVPLLQFLRFWDRPGALVNDGLVPVLSAPRVAADAFVQQSSPLATALVLAWTLGVLLMLVRHVLALRALSAMERAPFVALPAAWQQRAEDLRRTLGIARAVAVRLSDQVVTPCAARLLRPVVWIPLSLLARAPAEQIEALLAHELAHIARRDWLWNGVQCLVETVLFFHPAVWWLGRRIRQEREHACDDLAVAACGDAIVLAEALAALECERHSAPRILLSSDGGSLMQRITRLLSGPPARGRRGALVVLGLLTFAGALLAAQVGLAGGAWPDLHVQASTDGVLGPGDYRQIVANGVDKRRRYRAEVDAQGRLHETYEENGKPRPIDAGVRHWITEVSRLSAPPALPPLPPHPPLPPMPELDQAAKSLFALLATHPAVVARLGAPVVRTAGEIDGNLRLDGEAVGSADLEVPMRGSSGSGVVIVQATLEDGRWTLLDVDVE